MKEFTVELDPRATEDLNSAMEWLNENAPHVTGEWLHAIEAKIDSLQTMPERCPLAPENGRWEESLELRQLLFDDFSSVYRIIFEVAGRNGAND